MRVIGFTYTDISACILVSVGVRHDHHNMPAMGARDIKSDVDYLGCVTQSQLSNRALPNACDIQYFLPMHNADQE